MTPKSQGPLTRVIALCIVATINAAYLVFRWYCINFLDQQQGSFCDINSSMSCTDVLSHPASQILGLPFPAIALIVYPVLLTIAALGSKGTIKNHWGVLSILSGLGILFNGYFMYQEITVIHSICTLCLVCSAIIVTIFGIALWNNKK